ncbi:MAG TPA: glutathione S-transferase family protein [Gaiellaceae bacterium]|jgi:glutathione S-transferase|nr:glutathione S-transferase family protein [Gaiellaceae bacterium]
MRLYHVPNTRSTRVLWLLEEIGAPYDLTLMTGDERRGETHATRHPLGRVPVIEDDEGFVFESLAILLHIADLHPEAELIPPIGTHERALVYQWGVFAMTELEPEIIEVLVARRAEDTERAAEAATRFKEAAGVIEDALDDGDYLVGGRFTVADLVCAAVLLFGRHAELLDGFTAIDAYLERIEARPARQRARAVGHA